jgi:capsular polysaccharide biosynthesis protein
MNDRSDRTGLGLDYYAYVLGRQWTVIVSCAMIGSLLAAIYLMASPPATTATAVISIRPIALDAFSASSRSAQLLDPAEEAAIATSYPVALAAARELGSEHPTEIAERTTVTTEEESSVMRISFTDSSESLARTGADAVANAYLARRSSSATEERDEALAEIDERLGVLESRLANGGDSAGSAGQTDSAVTGEIANLLARESTLGQVNTSGGTVLTSAEDGRVSIEPSPPLTLIEGLILGAILGVIASFVVNRFDKRVRGENDVSRSTRAPVIASFDRRVGIATANGKEVFRTAAQYVRSTMPPKSRVLLVIDAPDGAAPSQAAIGFARALAESDRLVELVLPHAPATATHDIVSALGLAKAPAEEGKGSSYRSRQLSSLFVHFTDTSIGDEDAAPLVRDQLVDRASKTRSTKLFVIVLPSSSSPSLIMAIIGIADAAVAISVRGSSRTDALAFVADELDRAEKPLLGVIDAPRVPKQGQLGVAATAAARDELSARDTVVTTP